MLRKPGAETKTLAATLEIKAVDAEQRVITGYAAIAGNVDKVGDIVDPAALKKAATTPLDTVGVFVAHKMDALPVGIPLSMEWDGTGLLTKTLVKPTPEGDELLGTARFLQEHGRPLGMSFGYRINQSSYERLDGKTVRRIKDFDLAEYSFAASQIIVNPEALVTGVKADVPSGMLDLEESFEDLRRDLEERAEELLGVEHVAIIATFSDHVLVSPFTYDGEPTFYDIPYTIGDDKEPVLGQPVPKVQTYVDGVAKSGVDDRIAEHKAALDAEKRNALTGSSFAYVDADGGRHLPIHDAAHVRAALARFSQTSFEDDAAKKRAAKAVLSAAKKFGIDVADDSAVGQASKAQADNLEQKAGRVMKATHQEQMHGALKALTNLHAGTCDMGDTCPMGAKAEPEMVEQKALDHYREAIELALVSL